MYDTLVLSGGALKGFYLLGSIEACIDKNLLSEIKTYMGTSVGAIICYLLIIGYTPLEIMISFHKNRWLERITVSVSELITGTGVVNFATINDILEKMTLEKVGKYFTLSGIEKEFNKKLICCTYNSTKCITEYLSSENYPDLPCLVALRMSSNLPFVFDRFKYTDCYYIDGGITDNFPIIKAKEYGNKIIGIYVKVSDKSLQDRPSDGLLNYLLRLLQIPMSQHMKHRVQLCSDTCTIIPIITETINNMLEFNITSCDRNNMFTSGYDTTSGFLNSHNLDIKNSL